MPMKAAGFESAASASSAIPASGRAVIRVNEVSGNTKRRYLLRLFVVSPMFRLGRKRARWLFSLREAKIADEAALDRVYPNLADWRGMRWLTH